MIKHNYIWIALVIASVFGIIFLLKIAYANPLGLPDYAFTKPSIKEAYSFAKLNQNYLTDLPCNCGCSIDAKNHGGRLHSRGLIDCFMNGDVNAGGKWDAHASECGLCYEDALEAKKLYEEGKTKDEVKDALEAKYAKQIISTDTAYGGMNQ